MTLRIWGLLVALLILGESSQASAYHSDRKRVVQSTAYLLNKGEKIVGPFRVDYGILDKLQVGTYVVPWAFVIPNIQFKMLVFQNEHWVVSLRPGLFYADLAIPHNLYGIGPDSTDLKLWLVPIEGYVSLNLPRRLTLTLGGVYTAVAGHGHYDPDDFDGTAAASNAQVGLGLEWRVNRITALYLAGRYIAYQNANGVGSVTVDVDDATTADVTAKGTANGADASNGYSVQVSALFSWRYFNLRLGVGYGNYNAPGLNLVVPKRLPFPVFDIFWRF
ncbi:MAG: hypothetical protein QM778_22665 [Myxococcales bacterium]